MRSKIRLKYAATAVTLLILVMVSACALPCNAQSSGAGGAEQGRRLPVMNKFADAVEQLLRRYYKEIKRSDLSAETVRFEYNTMKFMVHLPLKTGEWQPAHEEVGPQRHGIVCVLNLSPGRWAGAAVMPQVFDHHYYKVLGMAPYDESKGCHMHASLYYPEMDISPMFMKEYQKLVNSFATYLSD